MVFAIRDYFEAGRQPPQDTNPPQPGTPLFEFLCQRLMASFNLPFGPLKYYEWMNLPDGDHLFFRGLSSRTIQDEWPQVQGELEADRLAPLGLVTVKSANPSDLSQCHQVLVYAFVWRDNRDLLVFVYDPNWPGRDDIVISLNTANPEDASITSTTGDTVRGFFLTDYQEPEGVLPA